MSAYARMQTWPMAKSTAYPTRNKAFAQPKNASFTPVGVLLEDTDALELDAFPTYLLTDKPVVDVFLQNVHN